MDHKRRVAAEGPLARKRLKDQSHAATSPSSPMLLLDGPSNRATRTSMVKDIQDLDKMVEDSAYKELLPVVRKELVTKRDVDMALIRRGVKRLKGANQEEMVCAVCPTPRRFKGWGALLIHAERYVKEKARQHRGYFRALKQVLQEEENTNSCGDHFQKNGRKDVQPPAQSLISAQAGNEVKRVAITADEDDEVASWKPNILIVQDDKLREVERIIYPRPSPLKSEDNRHACTATDRTVKPQLKEILAVYSSGKDGKRNVFVFPAAEVGYINGKELTLACSKEHKTLEYNCDDHRHPDNKANENAEPASIYNMTLKGWKNIKEEHGLKLLPDEEVSGRKGELFDDGKFDRISKIMTRWADNFKAINRNFQAQRSFRLGSRMHELDRVWQDDLKRMESYAPSTKKKVRNQITAIEDELKKEHLVWLQEVEDVREQFQRMADSMKKEEEVNNLRNLRCKERNLKKQHELEHEQMRVENMQRPTRVNSELLSKRYKRNVDGQLMVETWIDEYHRLRRESTKAKNERLRLQSLHDKVHTKAYITKKRECPICFELFRKPQILSRSNNDLFGKFHPVNKLCLDLTCPQRHKFKS